MRTQVIIIIPVYKNIAEEVVKGKTTGIKNMTKIVEKRRKNCRTYVPLKKKNIKVDEIPSEEIR